MAILKQTTLSGRRSRLDLEQLKSCEIRNQKQRLLNFMALGSAELSNFLYSRRTIKFISISLMLIGLSELYSLLIVVVVLRIHRPVTGQLRQTLTVGLSAHFSLR